MLDSGHAEEAEAALRRAIELQPHLAEAHFDLGIALYRTNRVDEAIDAYRRAIELQPDNAEAHCGLGVASLVAGRAEEASGHFHQALALRPDYATAHSNLVLCEQYCTGVTLAGLARAHAAGTGDTPPRTWGAPQPWSLNRDAERPLRLGFVSADFRSHPVGFFLAPVLENLRPHPCAVVCYHNRTDHDDLTRRLAAAATEWHDVVRLNDDALADRIRDGPDRPPVRPVGPYRGESAPGLCAATCTDSDHLDRLSRDDRPGGDGLPDRRSLPCSPRAEAHYREKMLRMPDAYVCFDPPEEAPAVGPLPAPGRGQITFGSFNNLAKLTPEVIATWAEILRRVPDSRLLLVTRGLGGARTRERIREAFAAAGADPDRVELQGKVLRGELLTAYNAMDVALDPFPYSGGMTTCEALWMGVPVVTCPGETFASRHSLAHLSNVGLTETIATDRRDYVERAVRLAQDLPHLAALRAGLRDRVVRSPLCDGERFAQQFMELLRGVWRQWCRQ